jgi:hypothetical protein
LLRDKPSQLAMTKAKRLSPPHSINEILKNEDADMSLMSERVSPHLVFAPLAAGTTTATIGNVVDLQASQSDSVYLVVAIGNSTGTGVSFTLQGSASTASFANLCTAGTTVAITVATTVSNKLVIADAKNVPYRYVTAISNSTAAVPCVVALLAYDSKKQAISASTVHVAQTFTAVNPTTTA